MEHEANAELTGENKFYYILILARNTYSKYDVGNHADAEYRQKLLREEIDSALEKICKKRKLWLYTMFFLAALPGVWNGMHLMAYVFYVDAEPHYCEIPELEKAGWTGEQIRNVSLPK